MRSQSLGQQLNLLVDVSTAGRKRTEWQTKAQLLRAIGSTSAELSQADRMAIEAGRDFSVQAHFECDGSAEPDGQSCRRRPSPSLYSESAQAGRTLGPRMKRIEIAFRQRPLS